jgi:hypothetical protein
MVLKIADYVDPAALDPSLMPGANPLQDQVASILHSMS